MWTPLLQGHHWNSMATLAQHQSQEVSITFFFYKFSLSQLLKESGYLFFSLYHYIKDVLYCKARLRFLEVTELKTKVSSLFYKLNPFHGRVCVWNVFQYIKAISYFSYKPNTIVKVCDKMLYIDISDYSSQQVSVLKNLEKYKSLYHKVNLRCHFFFVCFS